MVYSLFYTLAMLLVAPFLLLGGRTRRKYLHSLSARLGFEGPPLNPEGRPAVWLHAVSVGEALAAKPLVAEMRRLLPGFLIFVSTTTSTGREVAEKNLDADGFFYFPFDWRFAVRRALRSTRAGLCVVMETELWPNFVRELARRRVPLVLANGRISDRSFCRYRRLRRFFGPLLRSYAVLCAQSEADAERLVEMGARRADILVSGNLKFGQEQYTVDAGEVARLRELLAVSEDELVIVAGSTHEGEEKAILDALRAAGDEHGPLRLLLVPRRPERFDEVYALLQAEGVDCARYTELEGGPRRAKVVLIDAIGVLRSLYPLATVAFVGGSLIEHGGQNPLEASAAGVPVIFGPHMSNFREIASELLRHGAARQVSDTEELGAVLSEILADGELRKRMAQSARSAIEENQEALPLTAEAVRSALAVRGSYVRAPLILRALAKVYQMSLGIFRRDPAKVLARAPRLATPTVSVGGLSFGGSGKSPMVAMLARAFKNRGEKVAVLTRGYGGKGQEPLIVSDGRDLLAGAEDAGDEPVMLARNLPGLVVIKDRKRLRGGRLAEERFAPGVFILDDGFQHRAIGRDFNLLMLDADSILGAGMPCHLLREPLSFARAADAVVILSRNPAYRREAEAKLRRIGVDAPAFGADVEPTGCVELGSDEEVALERLGGMRLLVFCGIAVPERFALSLMRLGAVPVALVPFPDHHPYTMSDIEKLEAALKASGADAMITTAKDAQRLRSLSAPAGLGARILVLKVEMRLDRPEELLRMIEKSIS